MYQFKSVFAPFTLLLLLSGCATSSLTMPDKKTILISTDKQNIVIDGTVEKSSRVNMNNIAFVYQSLFRQADGTFIVYETVDLSSNYRYNYATQRTMDIVFEAKSISTIYMYQYLTFLQIETKNRELLNVLVDQSHEQYMTFAYGFSSEKFKEMIETINMSSKTESGALREEVMTFKDPDKAILSQWNTKMLVLDHIFVPIGRMMRP